LKLRFAKFYFAFSKDYIEEYIEDSTKVIKEKKEAITKKFYQGVHLVCFWLQGEKDRNKQNKISKSY